MKNRNRNKKTSAKSVDKKPSSKEKSAVLELLDNLSQLYKIQGMLLSRLQEQIRKLLS